MVAVKRYTAIAVRSRTWWSIRVPELPGAFAQARELKQIEAAAREVIVVLAKVAADAIRVTVRVEVSPGTRAAVSEAVLSRGMVDVAVARRDKALREAVRLLTHEGFSVRDARAFVDLSDHELAYYLNPGPASALSDPARPP